jgi:hypothetical protein
MSDGEIYRMSEKSKNKVKVDVDEIELKFPVIKEEKELSSPHHVKKPKTPRGRQYNEEKHFH